MTILEKLVQEAQERERRDQELWRCARQLRDWAGALLLALEKGPGGEDAS